MYGFRSAHEVVLENGVNRAGTTAVERPLFLFADQYMYFRSFHRYCNQFSSLFLLYDSTVPHTLFCGIMGQASAGVIFDYNTRHPEEFREGIERQFGSSP